MSDSFLDLAKASLNNLHAHHSELESKLYARIAELEGKLSKAESARDAAISEMTKYAQRSGQLEADNERLRQEVKRNQQAFYEGASWGYEQEIFESVVCKEVAAFRYPVEAVAQDDDNEEDQHDAEAAASGKGEG